MPPGVSPVRPASARLRYGWRREALCLAAIALATTLVFASGTADIAAARWFYSADATDHWPLGRQFPWAALYRAAGGITAALVLLGLAALAASLTVARRLWRGYAVLLLLAVALGPGLLVNGVFKDHWQHPRPRDLLEFGGVQHYVPSPLIGAEGGASFPCGHCTVGFLYATGWWVWKRRRPRWAYVSLAAGLALGALFGIGRMAAGAHFLSDVIWSALLAFAVVHLLCYHLLRLPAAGRVAVPARDGGGTADGGGGGGRAGSGGQRVATLVAVAGGVAVLLALFAMPHGTALTARVSLASLPGPPRILEVEADAANVSVVLVDQPAAQLTIEGELHGFGLPTSRLATHIEVLAQPQPRLRYRIEARGWLTDVDGLATLGVPGDAFERVIVNVRRGNIQVTDATRAGVVAQRRVRLELHSGHGHVQVTAPSLPGAARIAAPRRLSQS
ncbi:MAG TPA: phosphatase PAP2 family protein [Steroidobacteraceae bacterium]|jgi:lipid A 4'-phosphatase|nr:phosphatase PAP2 family protein [Steroidobacteraceae bacterium]